MTEHPGFRKAFAGPALVTALAASFVFSGCASLVNGTSQRIVVTSKKKEVLVGLEGDTLVRSLPAEITLRRKAEDQTLNVLYPRADGAGRDTVRVAMERAFNLATLANGMTGLWGLAGAAVDYGTGAFWRQEVSIPRKVPRDLRLDMNPHPWNTGAWEGSLAWVVGFKNYPEGTLDDGATSAGDFGLQLVLGRRGWPVLAEARTYFFSSFEEADNAVLFELGARKAWTDENIRPYLSGGVSFLEHSALPYGGFPVGIWGRAGLDVRFGSSGFFAPYLGYSRHDVVLSHGDTDGMTGGLQLGFLW